MTNIDDLEHEEINSFQSYDKGTVFIERLENGTVQLKVRSPGAQGYSFVNLTWDEWADLKSLDLPVPPPEIKF